MGGKQQGFGDYEQTTAKKRIKREKFLADREVNSEAALKQARWLEW